MSGGQLIPLNMSLKMLNANQEEESDVVLINNDLTLAEIEEDTL